MASNKVAGLPATRKVPTRKGKASDLNKAAAVHRQVAYSPKPFPDSSR